RRDDGDDRLLGIGQDRDVVGEREVADPEALVQSERGDVRLDGGGNVLGERLDVEVPEVMLDHPTLLHAMRLAGDVDGNFDRDLLVPRDPDEVDVLELPPQVIPLDLPGHGQYRVAVQAQFDQHVHPGVGVQRV